MRIQIDPVAKPRQTRSDVWKQRPAVMRYRAFADELRLKYPQPLSNRVNIIFWMPMPKSWNEKRKTVMCWQPHQQKPDIDNLAKAVFDALLEDDSKIYRCNLEKVWSDEGAITIEAI